jgi:hypothetical protein
MAKEKGPLFGPFLWRISEDVSAEFGVISGEAFLKNIQQSQSL